MCPRVEWASATERGQQSIQPPQPARFQCELHEIINTCGPVSDGAVGVNGRQVCSQVVTSAHRANDGGRIPPSIECLSSTVTESLMTHK
jgi:hypothetical protein